MALGILSLGYFILKEKGVFTLFADFNNQQIPFNILANHAIKSGETAWNWNIDLGSNFIGAFSFYNLGSPFFWVTLLVKPEYFMYVAGWIYILKYAIAGLTSFAYIQLFVKDKKYAILGSMLYTFSGFQASNLLFYHFHDVTAFFPLLLYGLEMLLIKRKKSVFALAVFINALVNYFFFFGEVIFTIIYFLIRFGKNKGFFKNIWSCMKEAIIGICMAGILFLPSVAFVLQNPRVGERITGKAALVFEGKKYVQILRALFLPGENMSFQSCLYSGEWSSCAAYLPMVGIILVLAFMIKQKKHWITKMLFICCIILFVPVLGSMFYMFNSMVYQRWLYMPILLMALASALVMEQKDKYPIKKCCIGVGFFTIMLTLGVWLWKTQDGTSIVYRNLLYWTISLIAVAGIIFTYIVMEKINKKWYITGLYVTISLFCVSTTFLNCLLYRKSANFTSQSFYEEINSNQEIKYKDFRYRFICKDNLVTMVQSVAGTGGWCSTVGAGIFEFYESLGLKRFVDSPKGPEGTEELLAGKYYIALENESNIYADLDSEEVDFQNGEVKVIQIIEDNGEKKTIYELEQTLPIGITYETYMKKSEFLRLPAENRALAMIKTLIIPDNMESEVSKFLREYNVQFDGEISSENKENDIQNHLNECSEVLQRNKNGFYSRINADAEKYAFFSIPNDSGWSATVNGEKVDILNVNGLMAIPIQKGSNNIMFEYKVPLETVGKITTIVGFLLLVVYQVSDRKRKVALPYRQKRENVVK